MISHSNSTVGLKINYYFSNKTYVVGTQKKILKDTVLLSTQNIFLNRWIRQIHAQIKEFSSGGPGQYDKNKL